MYGLARSSQCQGCTVLAQKKKHKKKTVNFLCRNVCGWLGELGLLLLQILSCLKVRETASLFLLWQIAVLIIAALIFLFLDIVQP